MPVHNDLHNQASVVLAAVGEDILLAVEEHHNQFPQQVGWQRVWMQAVFISQPSYARLPYREVRGLVGGGWWVVGWN